MAPLKVTTLSDRDYSILNSIAHEKMDDRSLDRDEREAWAQLTERFIADSVNANDLRTLSLAVRADSLLQNDKQTAAHYRALSDLLTTKGTI